jgi:hypothetical protein
LFDIWSSLSLANNKIQAFLCWRTAYKISIQKTTLNCLWKISAEGQDDDVSFVGRAHVTAVCQAPADQAVGFAGGSERGFPAEKVAATSQLIRRRARGPVYQMIF